MKMLPVFPLLRRLSPEVLAEMGITPSVLRLSVGLEHSTDLIKDLTQALS